jgi:hypothetical protein
MGRNFAVDWLPHYREVLVVAVAAGAVSLQAVTR